MFFSTIVKMIKQEDAYILMLILKIQAKGRHLLLHHHPLKHLAICLYVLIIINNMQMMKVMVYSFHHQVNSHGNNHFATIWGSNSRQHLNIIRTTTATHVFLSNQNLEDNNDNSLKYVNLKKNITSSQQKNADYSTSNVVDRLPSLSNYSRRELFSLCPALGIALCNPLNANAENSIASTTSPNTISSMSSNSMMNNMPYSSVRHQKSLILSNGLKVLLVNDELAAQSTAALIVNGAGQFQDPLDIPGLAHLMEHMSLSYNNRDSKAMMKQPDFEDWLEDNGGTSNGFTAYHQTGFYFNCPHETLGRALLRFSSLFVESNVIDTCNNKKILDREISRVDSELDLNSLFSQIEYVTKSFVNYENPYSRFARGNKASLDIIPRKLRNINVSERLIKFFHQYYLPTQAVLVVVSNQKDFSSLKRWVTVTQFSVALSTRKKSNNTNNLGATVAVGSISDNFVTGFYPGRFLKGNRLKHLILSAPSEKKDTLIIQWVLNEDYRKEKINNAVEIAFVLNQILGRKGPGSLYLYLRRQGWVQNGSALPPQISVPFNVSGFQILKLQLLLTIDGFINRSKVVSAVYDSIEILRNRDLGSLGSDDTFVISREIMAQYATTAKLFGYTLAPRPPDALELATDTIAYGMTKVESMKWYRFPTTEELGGLGLNRMRRAVSNALKNMFDPENALIIITASSKAIDATQRTANGKKNPIPSLSSSKWNTERISGAHLYFEDMLPNYNIRSRALIGQSYLNNIIIKEEFLPPIYNPFVLTSLRPTRNTNFNTNFEQLFLVNESPSSAGDHVTWTILKPGRNRIPLPISPPETNCRSAFVIQFCSARPKIATVEQAAYAELWKHSFFYVAKDLAELGAPGGLAYELKFNAYGLRISFLGLCQTIGSYSRRMVQMLTKHQQLLLKGPKTLPESVINAAIADANTVRMLSPSRKRITINTIQKATSSEVAVEGISFLKSITNVVAFSEGDLTPYETESLLNDMRIILKDTIGSSDTTGQQQQKGINVIPSVDELVDAPSWKPRNASPCYIAGVSLMSDVCGRILR